MKYRKIVALMMCVVMALAMVGCGTYESTEATTTTGEHTTGDDVKFPVMPTTRKEKETTTEEQTTVEKNEEKYDDIFLPGGMRFGMAAAEIKDNETRYEKSNPVIKNTEYIVYRGTRDSYYEMDVECVYCCIDKKLVSFWCEFDKKSYRIESYYDLYQDVKEAIVERYGECTSEEMVWTDDTYKDNKAKWDKAFEYGYVTINTRFDIGNDQVILIRWDYNGNGLMIITTTKDNEKNL